MTTTYWSIRKAGMDREFLGIIATENWGKPAIFNDSSHISKELGHILYGWNAITKAEFETYREFGIKEFKL